MTVSYPSKQSMKSIECSFIYVDSNANVKDVIHNQTIPLENSSLSRESLLQLIQKNKITSDSNIKYKLTDILLFNIDDVNNIENYLENENNLKPLSFVKDIVVPPSLPFFHPLNNLYIIYQEIVKGNKNNKTKKNISILFKRNVTLRKKSILDK